MSPHYFLIFFSIPCVSCQYFIFQENLNLGTYKVYIIKTYLYVNFLRNFCYANVNIINICIIGNLGLICHVYHDYRLFKYSSMASGNGDMVKFDLETLEPVDNTYRF